MDEQKLAVFVQFEFTQGQVLCCLWYLFGVRKMDSTRKIFLLAVVLIATPALAKTASHTVQVPVVASAPIVRITTEKIPHKSCYDQRVKVLRSSGNHSATPSLLGAILGGTAAGALGHNSHYQPVIAGVCALLGASIGNDYSHRRNAAAYYVTENHCEVDYELRDVEQIIGYRVSYQYGDTIYQTETRNHPGESMTLHVDLRPVK
ncbi:MAG: glycine zipper 2TM domain-containing protein [Halioglobus sp.]